jgi:molybdate transport repressor ModE-like protein
MVEVSGPCQCSPAKRANGRGRVRMPRTASNEALVDREPWLGVEFRHLAALEAIARTGSFRGAADDLGYVQSAISQQIAYLEQLVGLRLVERTRGNKQVNVTDAGHLLIDHTGAILARLSAARADLDALANGEPSTVRVGVPQTVAAGLLPTILRRLSVRAPEVDVSLAESASEDALVGLVQRGDLDLAFTSYPLPDEPLDACELISAQHILLVRAVGGASAAPPTLAELAELPIIAHAAFARVEEHLRSQGVEPRVVRRADMSATLEALVAAGLGAAIVPSVSVSPNRDGIEQIDVSHLFPPLVIGLCWHRERRLSTQAQAFRATACAACEHDLRPDPVLRLAS